MSDRLNTWILHYKTELNELYEIFSSKFHIPRKDFYQLVYDQSSGKLPLRFKDTRTKFKENENIFWRR